MTYSIHYYQHIFQIKANGMVVEEGSHDELLEADGHYRRLVEHQCLGCKVLPWSE